MMRLTLLAIIAAASLAEARVTNPAPAKVETNEKVKTTRADAPPKPATKVETKPAVAKAVTKPAAASPKPAAKVDAKPVVASAKPAAKAETKPAVAKAVTKPAAASPKPAAKVVAKVEAKPVAASAKPAAKVETKPAVAKAVTKPAAASPKPSAKVDAKPVAASAKPAAKVETKPAVAKIETKPAKVETKAASKPSVRGAAVKDVPHSAVVVAVRHEQSNKTIHEHAEAAQKSAEEAKHHLAKAEAAYAKTAANVEEAKKTGKKIEGTADDIKTLYTPPEKPKPKAEVPESGARPSAVPAFVGLFCAVVVSSIVRNSC